MLEQKKILYYPSQYFVSGYLQNLKQMKDVVSKALYLMNNALLSTSKMLRKKTEKHCELVTHLNEECYLKWYYRKVHL